MSAPADNARKQRYRQGRFPLALLMCGLLLGAGETEAQNMPYRWELVTMKAPFAARDGAGALSLQGTMYLLGGWNPGDKVNFPKICNSQVWASTDGLNWREICEQAPWEGRHCAGWVVHQDKLWVIGGDVNQRHHQNDVWSSPDGVNWTQVCDNVPWGNRSLHLAFSFQGKLWVMGGQSMTSNDLGVPEKFFNDIWCSEDGAQWTRVVEQAPWTPRGMFSGQAVLHDRLWLLGGGTYDTPLTRERQFYNDVWSTPDGINWTCHTPSAPWHPRQFHEVAAWDGKLWVMEGYHKVGGNRQDVWYSSDGVNWTELPNTPWTPRHAASLFMHDDALWMVAGMTSEVWKLVRN